MRSRTIDGILVVKPTRDDILSLQVGDLAPTCFGTMARVVDIFGRGDDVHGRAYVCYYTEWGTNARLSHSLSEDEIVPTVPLTARFHRIDLVPWEEMPS